VRGIVRVSSPEIGLIFGWSHQYTQKILNALLESEDLVLLQRGSGQRAAKYLVPSISCNQQELAATNSVSTSQPPRSVARHVPSCNQKTSKEPQNTLFQKSVGPLGNALGKDKDREYAYQSEHIRNGTVFDNVPSNLKRVKKKSSPFKRFRIHCENVRQWSGPDFVCYFSFCHRVKYGEMPTINWKMECGAANTLLKRLGGERWKLKVFLQQSFLFLKRKPNGLRTLTNDYVFRDIIAQRYTEDELDEYADDYVFPWLYEKMKRESLAASREANARSIRRSLGIYD